MSTFNGWHCSQNYFNCSIEAERGYVPNIFTTRSKFGTPTIGIIFNTLVIIAFSCADFGQLLELLNSVYAMSLLMEYAAFVKLRLYHKECKPYDCLSVWDDVFVLHTYILFLYIIFILAHLILLLHCRHQLYSATAISYSGPRLGCNPNRNPTHTWSWFHFCHIKLVRLCLLRGCSASWFLPLQAVEDIKKPRME